MLSDLWNVLKAGSAVRDAVIMKRAQLGASIGTLLISIVALAKSFGYDVPLTNDQLIQIGGTFGIIFGLFNHYATAASTEKIDGLGREPKMYPVDPKHPHDLQRAKDSEAS